MYFFGYALTISSKTIGQFQGLGVGRETRFLRVLEKREI